MIMSANKLRLYYYNLYYRRNSIFIHKKLPATCSTWFLFADWKLMCHKTIITAHKVVSGPQAAAFSLLYNKWELEQAELASSNRLWYRTDRPNFLVGFPMHSFYFAFAVYLSVYNIYILLQKVDHCIPYI